MMQKKFKQIFTKRKPREIARELFVIVQESLQEKYGANPDERISNRVEEEWDAIERQGMVADVAALYEIVSWLKENKYPYCMQSCAGSSFILYLLGITFGNPLPAHTLCPKCQSVTWYDGYADGFDISNEYVCEKDNTTVIPDGHNIPWQPLFGYGELSHVLNIYLPRNSYNYLQEVLASHWLATIDEDFPLTCYTQDESTNRNCIDVSNLTLTFVLNQEEISPLFYERNVSAYDCEAIVENWKEYVNLHTNDKSDLEICHEPDTVADVIALTGLLNSGGAWDDVTKIMVREMGYSYSDLICFRDDVFTYLLEHDFLKTDAWRGMESVRKGRNLPFFTDSLLTSRDKWVFSRIQQIKYLFPKAHSVENLIFRLKSFKD